MMMQQLHGAPPTFWRRYSLSNRCQPLSIARKERYHRCDVARLVTQAGEVDAVAVDADAVAVVEAVAADALPLPAALAQALPQTFPTMTSARKACRRRRVRVDGAVGSCGTQVSAGQTLQVLSEQSAAAAAAKERPPRRRLVPAGLDVPVVYEDGSVAVVVKPWGLKCHGRGGRGGGGGHHLAAYLPLVLSPAQPGDDGGAAAGGPDRGDFAPNPAHRLDRLTGGLLAVAKTREAAAALTRQFESRGVGKRYRAVVAGRLEAPAGGSAGTAAAVVVAARLEGREALTEVTVVGHSRCLRYGGWVTTVDLAPKTGRRHQLRRHLALCLGHPILGDPLYTPWARLGRTADGVDTLLAATPDKLRAWAASAAGGAAGGSREVDAGEQGRSRDSGGDSDSDEDEDDDLDQPSAAAAAAAAPPSAPSPSLAPPPTPPREVELLRGWGMALFASSLEFDHPVSPGARLSFTAPEPARFEKLRRQQAARWDKFHGGGGGGS